MIISDNPLIRYSQQVRIHNLQTHKKSLKTSHNKNFDQLSPPSFKAILLQKGSGHEIFRKQSYRNIDQYAQGSVQNQLYSLQEHSQEEEPMEDTSNMSPGQLKKYNQLKKMKQLSNPYHKCRKGCSTYHSHKWSQSFNDVQSQDSINIHRRFLSSGRVDNELQSSLKLQEMDLRDRPRSADSNQKDRINYLIKIDWAQSGLYSDLVYDSNKDQSNDDQLDIYTEVEVNYIQSILKKKLHSKDIVPPEELHKIMEKAFRTLKYQMNELLLQKAYNVIEEQYKSYEIQENITNCIKVLLRSKKLFEAKLQIIRTLKYLIRLSAIKKQIKHIVKQFNSQKLDTNCERVDLERLFKEYKYLKTKALSEIQLIQHEHKSFRRPFIFKMKNQLVELNSNYKQIKLLLQNHGLYQQQDE
eukprot:403368174